MIDNLKSWKTDCTDEDLQNIFKNNREYFKHFGGDIETFLTKAKIYHSKRVFTLPKENKFILTNKDFDNALQHIKDDKEKSNSERLPPSHMYM